MAQGCPAGNRLGALPEDEDEAAEMVAFLLAHGADRKLTNPEGLTVEQELRRRGLIELADMLEPET